MLRVRHYPSMWSEREVKEDLHLKLEAKSYKKQKVSYPRAVSKKKKKRKDGGGGMENRGTNERHLSSSLTGRISAQNVTVSTSNILSFYGLSFIQEHSARVLFFFLLKPTSPRINNVQCSFAS